MPRRADLAKPVKPSAATPQRGLSGDDTPAKPPEHVSREAFEQLKTYVALVQKWTKSINLVSQGDQDPVWSRHVLDSLRLLPLMPKGAARGVDLGSGAGFPGLVLALASGIPFDLIEADQRKAAFLVEAQRVTQAPVTIHCARIEDLRLPPAPLVTARALAPLAALLALAHPLLLPGGTALFPKGARSGQEIADAERQWRMQVNRFEDPQHPGSTILAITNLAHA